MSRHSLSTNGLDADAVESSAPDRLDSDALENSAPEPLEHATPGAELAEAQMAIGRPEIIPEPGGEDELESADEFELEAEAAAESREALDDSDSAADENDNDELETPPPSAGGGARRPHRRRGASDGGDGDGDFGDSESELAAVGSRVPAARENIVSRLVHFLQGSWRELQRVQWPDRRQVMQATGVVIGFVIVAGLFLGVADFLAGKLVNFILK